MIVGYLVGGWLLDTLGWRMTFITLAIPGLLVAALVKLTLKEPRSAEQAINAVVLPSLKDTFKHLWQKQTFRHMFMAFCVGNFFFMGVGQWLATFFIRSHGMSTAAVGLWLAVGFGCCGLFGNYLGGYSASRFFAGKEQLQMRVIGFLYLLNVIVSFVVYLASNTYVALVFAAASSFLLSLSNGPVFASIQSLVPERMRSVAIAILFMFSNLIGFGLGPLLLGISSDLLNPSVGQQSLRYALALFCPGGLWVAYIYWKAGNSIEKDIEDNIANGANLDHSKAISHKPQTLDLGGNSGV